MSRSAQGRGILNRATPKDFRFPVVQIDLWRFSTMNYYPMWDKSTAARERSFFSAIRFLDFLPFMPCYPSPMHLTSILLPIQASGGTKATYTRSRLPACPSWGTKSGFFISQVEVEKYTTHRDWREWTNY